MHGGYKMLIRTLNDAKDVLGTIDCINIQYGNGYTTGYGSRIVIIRNNDFFVVEEYIGNCWQGRYTLPLQEMVKKLFSLRKFYNYFERMNGFNY